MKTHIFIDAYDEEDGSQKCFILNGSFKQLEPEVVFDKIFLKISSKSANLIALDKITHIKEEEEKE